MLAISFLLTHALQRGDTNMSLPCLKLFATTAAATAGGATAAASPAALAFLAADWQAAGFFMAAGWQRELVDSWGAAVCAAAGVAGGTKSL